LKLETNTRLAGAVIFRMTKVIAKLGIRMRMEMFAANKHDASRQLRSIPDEKLNLSRRHNDPKTNKIDVYSK
jgi:hypothetical protein